MKNEQLIHELSARRAARSPQIVQALEHIDRKDFVPSELESLGYLDAALPIGAGQTISQPYTVAFMLELLQPQRGDRILDVGSGSGWTTALLAHIAGPRGHVIGTEIIPDIAAFGDQNLAKYGFTNADIRLTNVLGAPEEAPFDRILVSAAADHVPQRLLDQLKDDGILVMPVGNDIVRVHKGEGGAITADAYGDFVFVPLRT